MRHLFFAILFVVGHAGLLFAGNDVMSANSVPPKPPGEEGGGGGGSGGDTTVLTGVLTLNSGTNTLDGVETGGTLTSLNSDENVILVQSNAVLEVSNYTLTKSGDTSSEDNSNFFALNAVVAAKSAGKVYIDNSTLNSNAKGANCLFASGTNSTIYAYRCTLNSTKDSSRGLDATYGGKVIASEMKIYTKSEHCASLATDRGNGYISATYSRLSTEGVGSALIYSTGVIEANCVTGSATAAQIAGIEGLSVIRIKDSVLSGSARLASEPVANGVIIYQSRSGDSSEGTATFEASDSTLTSAITNNGAMFYITHSSAVITLQNVDLEFDTDDNYLLMAAGNNGEHGWGTVGSNGGDVVFTAIDQTLTGKITVDGISSLDLYLVNSDYEGTFINDTTYTGDGDGIELFVDSNSTWTVTASCTLKSLTVASGAKVVDGSGKTVSIANSSGTKYVTGASSLTVTVSTYSTDDVTAQHTISDFKIDRSDFNEKYGTSQGLTVVTPGVVSESYGDAQSATNAAAAINNDKANRIAVPTGVEGTALQTYLSKVAASVTGDNCIVIDLTPVAQSNEQSIVDCVVTSSTAVASLTSTNASLKVTISTTTPGLYYWILGGTDASAVTNAGVGVLSTDGGSVELAKPTLDATKGQAFFKIAAGVTAPVQSDAD